MAKNKQHESVNAQPQSIRAGTKLPPEVAMMVTLAVFMRREGDDATGQYDKMAAQVLLQADGDEHLMDRLADRQAQLQPAISAFVKALTEALGGEIARCSQAPTIGGRRIGRA